MSAYFQSIHRDGFANWMHFQAREELAHAIKFYDVIGRRGGQVVLETIAAPPTRWDSPLAVFEATLSHEQKVTGLINKLVESALEAHDHAGHVFLQWFVTEQVEEEEGVSTILEQLKRMGESDSGLYMLDRELARRGPSEAAETAA